MYVTNVYGSRVEVGDYEQYRIYSINWDIKLGREQLLQLRDVVQDLVETF